MYFLPTRLLTLKTKFKKKLNGLNLNLIKIETLKNLSIVSYGKSLTYIDGSCAVDHINFSLVTQVSRQMHSDGYQWRLFWYWNKTGLQTVSRPVEQIIVFFHEVAIST